MKIINTTAEMQRISSELKRNAKTISVVPTMGYLHEGHCSLMRAGKQISDILITTLFVNPTQFAPNEDFEKYPRDFERDCLLAEANGTDYLFYPEVKEMYPNDFNTEIKISGITDKFDGTFRPHHFNGVATIVAKLFNATLPDFAIFGQKDYQQTLVVKQLVKDLNFPVKIMVSPTLRENDDLAMSSRNVYLNTEERKNATILYQSLSAAYKSIKEGNLKRTEINDIMTDTLLKVKGLEIDYAAAADADAFDEPDNFIKGQNIVLLIACKLGKTRLIDNMVINI